MPYPERNTSERSLSTNSIECSIYSKIRQEDFYIINFNHRDNHSNNYMTRNALSGQLLSPTPYRIKELANSEVIDLPSIGLIGVFLACILGFASINYRFLPRSALRILSVDRESISLRLVERVLLVFLFQKPGSL